MHEYQTTVLNINLCFMCEPITNIIFYHAVILVGASSILNNDNTDPIPMSLFGGQKASKTLFRNRTVVLIYLY